MSNNLQTLKGFRDYIGAEARQRTWLIEKIRTVYEQFGFEPIETPALEYESLLLGKYGTEADKLIYGFEDRGGRRVALRYDQTVPTARVIAQYRNQLVFPYKRYQIQNVWRSEKPQKGRYREFTQCDIDIIGTTSSLADAEVLAAVAKVYKEIGFDSAIIKVNDRQQLIQTIQQAGISEEMIFSVIQTIDKLDKKSEEEVLAELVEKGIEAEKGREVMKNLQSSTMSDQLKKIVDEAYQMGVEDGMIQFAPTLARGLDYYTGLIIEVIIPEFIGGSVGGGGRYDKLINDLVGVDMPAVGFAVGFPRTLEAAIELGKVPDFKNSSQVLVTIFSEELQNESLKVATMLRAAGISTEMYLDNKRLDQQLKYANAKGIPFVIVIGPDEAGRGVVKVKNMATREEKEMSVEDAQKILS